MSSEEQFYVTLTSHFLSNYIKDLIKVKGNDLKWI